MEETIKGALINLVKSQILKALVAKLPFFAGGIPGTIAGFLIGKLSVFLVEETILGVKILSSRVEINGEVKRMEEAVSDSKQEGLSDEEKQEILKRFNDAANELINNK